MVLLVGGMVGVDGVFWMAGFWPSVWVMVGPKMFNGYGIHDINSSDMDTIRSNL